MNSEYKTQITQRIKDGLNTWIGELKTKHPELLLTRQWHLIWPRGFEEGHNTVPVVTSCKEGQHLVAEASFVLPSSMELDLDALEHNFDVIADTFRDTDCKMRTHTKNLKSPLLAHMQMRAGGTLGGVCTAKVAEAEVMVEGGVDDILIPNQIVTKDKIKLKGERLSEYIGQVDDRIEMTRCLSREVSPSPPGR